MSAGGPAVTCTAGRGRRYRALSRPASQNILALCAVLAVLPFITGGNCDTSNDSGTEASSKGSLYVAVEYADSVFIQGMVTRRSIKSTSESDEITYRWTPPKGATHVQIDGAKGTPTRDGDDYVFTADSDRRVNLSYGAPPAPPGAASVTIVDTVQAFDEQGGTITSVRGTVLGSGRDSWRGAPAAAADLPEPRSAALFSDPPMVWRHRLWFYGHGGVLTTEKCQQYVDAVSDSAVFGALRFPVTPGLSREGGSYGVPAVVGGSVHSFISFLSYEGDNSTVVEMPLKLRPDRMAWAEDHLPASAGERWLALGVDGSSDPECPAGLSVPDGSWEGHVSTILDFGGDAGECEGCVLDAFLCRAGTDPPELPGANATASQLLAMSFSSYDDPVTCLGPFSIQLNDWSNPDSNPPLRIGGAGTAWVQPGDRVMFHHDIVNTTPTQHVVDLAISSQAGISWTLYEGDFDGPDLGSPITGPVTVEGNGFGSFVWVIADIPADALSGREVVRLTATPRANGALPVWNSNMLWIGDWVAPPGAPQPIRKAEVRSIESTCP